MITIIQVDKNYKENKSYNLLCENLDNMRKNHMKYELFVDDNDFIDYNYDTGANGYTELKIIKLLNTLKKYDDDEIIMYIDAFDTRVVAPYDEIKMKFISYDVDVLYSVEKNCWPIPEFSSNFNKDAYLNSGTILFVNNKYQKLLNILKIIYDNKSKHSCDQFYHTLFTTITLANIKIKLDENSQIFKCLWGESVENFEKINGRFKNKNTTTFPCVFHGNGNGKDVLNKLFYDEEEMDTYQENIIDTKHGKFFIRPNDLLGKRLIENNDYEPHFYNIVKNVVKEGDICIDCGANLGHHTVVLSKLAGSTGKVFSVEPLRLIYQQLNANIFLNNIRNVVTMNVALGNEEKYIQMDYVDVDGDDINIGQTKIGSGGDIAKMVRLDDIISDNISFIKLDVQGSEVALIDGAIDIISNSRPIIFVEVEDMWLRYFNESADTLINKIISLDYILIRINNNYPCDHVAIPREKSSLIGEIFKDTESYSIVNDENIVGFLGFINDKKGIRFMNTSFDNIKVYVEIKNTSNQIIYSSNLDLVYNVICFIAATIKDNYTFTITDTNNNILLQEKNF